MPIAVLVIRPFGILVQVVRNSMLGALAAPYVKTARAKGIRERPIIFVHALRNAMLPVVTVAGDQAAGIINGAVIVETHLRLAGRRQADDRRHHPARLRRSSRPRSSSPRP